MNHEGVKTLVEPGSALNGRQDFIGALNSQVGVTGKYLLDISSEYVQAFRMEAK